MKLTIPDLSFVVLIGVSGSGKSTFARKHFKPTEILSSDSCRGLVSDDENSQAATKDAFELLHFIARKRLAAGKLTVVDATNVQPESRKPLLEIAREFHCLPVAIVLDLPERVAHDRNKTRADRDFGPHVIRQQSQQLHRSLRGLKREGFRHIHVLKSLEEVEAVVIERLPLWNNRKHEHGPFDIVGDVHGCFGLPIRYNWATEYRGGAMVVYGHTPVPEPEWLNRTINIDTGCVFGGKLTALRYPERELVSVSAKRTYAEPHKPFLPPEEHAPALSMQQQQDDLLDLADITGKRIVSTRLHGNVTIREENATAALEVMSRFAANPKWLIYLPPTMSPSETSKAPGLLEHPAEAFAYFRHAGVPRVVCEEKHMGSRAVIILCRDEEAARRRFGVGGEGIGICYTRTGRRFFDNAELEERLLERVRAAATAAGFWDEFKSDWLCLDCELMPWSAKAQELLKQQYAAVGASARATLAEEVHALEQAAKRGLEVNELIEHATARQQRVNDYTAAYRRYCWSVDSVSDLKLAPFHLLATEGHVHVDKPNDWHMHTLARLAGGIIVATPFHVIDLTSPESEAKGVAWWEKLTAGGGEGMVVKPQDFIDRGRRGLVQPAVKCRGREYLRIIYGPEYTAPEHLERLRARGLSAKRFLALREFALGIEALERFVRKEPLRRVHEAVFGVLALESEPVDPRL